MLSVILGDRDDPGYRAYLAGMQFKKGVRMPYLEGKERPTRGTKFDWRPNWFYQGPGLMDDLLTIGKYLLDGVEQHQAARRSWHRAKCCF